MYRIQDGIYLFIYGQKFPISNHVLNMKNTLTYNTR
jgi:hypothetical protein